MKKRVPALAERKKIILGVALAIFLVAGYAGRGYLRDAWAALRTPDLPPAEPFVPRTDDTGAPLPSDAASPFEAGYSTSESYILETSPSTRPPQKDPLVFEGQLPEEVNLDVPFTSQAPHANLDEPYQEACEEASAIMVDAFYRKQTGKMDPTIADTEIKKLVTFENGIFGYYEDTSAEQTARFIREYYGYKTVVKPFSTADEIKEVLALGYPVILPAAGKLLGNPNFRNGGPPYHMLVIRGYTDKVFITNDPGTRNGQGFTYSYETIMNAAHDWTGSKDTVTTGKRVMLIVLP